MSLKLSNLEDFANFIFTNSFFEVEKTSKLNFNNF